MTADNNNEIFPDCNGTPDTRRPEITPQETLSRKREELEQMKKMGIQGPMPEPELTRYLNGERIY